MARHVGRSGTQEKVKVVEIVDPHLVRVHIKEPRPDFMRFCGTLSTGAGWVVPKKYVEQVWAMKADDEGMAVQAFLGSGTCSFIRANKSGKGGAMILLSAAGLVLMIS